MKGNSAIFKCLIPSFVADFVSVEAWVDEEGTEFLASDKQSMSNEIIQDLNNLLESFLSFL